MADSTVAAHAAEGRLVLQEKAKLRKVLRRFDLVLRIKHPNVHRPYRVPGGSRSMDRGYHHRGICRSHGYHAALAGCD
jgi:hypothetical protein